MRKYLIFVPLVALLAFAIWFAIRAWNSAEAAPIPTSGYVALGLGVTFSILIGCGLMALIFYSSRRGYDTPPQYETTDDD